VGGGVTYAHLSPQLEAKGWALPNLASLPHISIIGAAATGTHGSGVNNTGLAKVIKAVKFVDGKGNIQSLSTTSPGTGAVLLGALGPIIEMTLALEPSFHVLQCVYRNLPFQTFYKHPKEILGAAYSVSLFTNWQNERFSSVWVKHKISRTDTTSVCPETFYGAHLAKEAVHPIEGIDASATSTQTPIGLWYEKLPHFRPDHTPSVGVEMQAEFFVSRQHEVEAVKAYAEVFKNEQLREAIQVSEVRTMKADGFYLSPCREDPQGCVAIHCTMIRDWAKVKPAIEAVQRALLPYRPVPHWGKLFTLSREYIQTAVGDNIKKFKQVISPFDPQGKFQNDFLTTYFSDDVPSSSKKDEL